MAGRLLSLGHGYSAQALARRLIAQGWQVTGTVRDPAKAAALAVEGVTPLVWPGTPLGPALAEATHIVTSIPPGPDGDPVLAAEGRALAEARPSWVGYLSTTGVYGDHDGGWVDETTPVAPRHARARARVTAEAAWLATGLPVHIFRLAGIYGPGRGPFEKLRDGTARRIVKPGQLFGRIHVDDIAATLLASIASPAPGTVYNVTDDEPAASDVVLSHAARLLGLPDPPAVAWDDPGLSPMVRSFYADARKVSNRRLRNELGVDLAYPTYREGLAAILAAEG